MRYVSHLVDVLPAAILTLQSLMIMSHTLVGTNSMILGVGVFPNGEQLTERPIMLLEYIRA